MNVLETDERGRGVIDLSVNPAERRALLRARAQLNLEWRAGDHVWIRGAGYVGTVVLSSRVAIRIATKVPVGNLLALASLAYRTSEVPPSLGEGLYDASDAIDWLAALLITEAERLADGGLRSGYVESRGSLPYVRGRISFHASGAWHHPGLVDCEFSDFVADTPENQVIRATLELLLARRLLGGLRVRVLHLINRLPSVSVVANPAGLLPKVRINRLNRSYEPCLDLCRVFLAQAGLDAPGDKRLAPAFMFPLAEVYEAAVCRYLEGRLPGVRAQMSQAFTPTAGAPAHTLTYRPDITVGDPPRLVIDTKYAEPEVKNQYGKRSFRNSNAYQIAFYAHALGCPGVLLYPLLDRDVNVDFRVEGVDFTMLTVDLEAPALAGLAVMATELERRLANSDSVSDLVPA